MTLGAGTRTVCFPMREERGTGVVGEIPRILLMEEEPGITGVAVEAEGKMGFFTTAGEGGKTGRVAKGVNEVALVLTGLPPALPPAANEGDPKLEEI